MRLTYTEIRNVDQPTVAECRRQGEANRERFLVTHPGDYGVQPSRRARGRKTNTKALSGLPSALFLAPLVSVHSK